MAKKKKKKVEEKKHFRFTAYCFKCKKLFESDEEIVHEHSMVINDHANLTSTQIKGGKHE